MADHVRGDAYPGIFDRDLDLNFGRGVVRYPCHPDQDMTIAGKFYRIADKVG